MKKYWVPSRNRCKNGASRCHRRNTVIWSFYILFIGVSEHSMPSVLRFGDGPDRLPGRRGGRDGRIPAAPAGLGRAPGALFARRREGGEAVQGGDGPDHPEAPRFGRPAGNRRRRGPQKVGRADKKDLQTEGEGDNGLELARRGGEQQHLVLHQDIQGLPGLRKIQEKMPPHIRIEGF